MAYEQFTQKRGSVSISDEEGATMETQVKEMLRKQKTYLAERKMLAVCLESLHDSKESDKMTRAKLLDQRLVIIDSWLLLLTDDEAFVIKRHLIDGIDWPRVAYEYEKLWGTGFAKAERTLRSYQKNALEKIVDFTIEHSVIPK